MVLYAQTLSLRGEENELASTSVCECMCGCECDLSLSSTNRRNETLYCHLVTESGPGGHTEKHVQCMGGRVE